MVDVDEEAALGFLGEVIHPQETAFWEVLLSSVFLGT